MSEPDVRWEGVSHEWIVALASNARGPEVTERLEARLTSTAEALARTADLTNSVLQRVNSGEWAGNAAALAAAAMQAMRDFDDTLGQHGKFNSLAAYGQSDNVAWVKANVPPVVDVPIAQVPTGSPADVLNSTVDHHEQLQAAKNAEEQARRVMRHYEVMTKERIANLPPMPSVPQVVVSGGVNTITVDPGDHVSPRDGAPGGGDTGTHTVGGTAEAPRPGEGQEQVGSQIPSGNNPSSSDPANTSPSGTIGTSPLTPTGIGNEAPRSTATPTGSGVAAIGPLRDGGQPGRPVGAGPRTTETRPGTRTTEMMGRTRGGSTGIAPVGTTMPGKSDEDKEHKVRYGVPDSEIFEPDNADGLLYDPFRPGSFVAPASIGDDDDE